MIAWTLCGVLAVVAAIAYSTRAPESPAPVSVAAEAPPTASPAPPPAPAPENTVRVKRDTGAKRIEAKQPAPPRRPDTVVERVRPTISPPLTKWEPHPDSARIRIGARPPGGTLFVNDISRGEIGELRWVVIPAGNVRLSVREASCTPWDTTITAAGASEIVIGTRNPRC